MTGTYQLTNTAAEIDTAVQKALANDAGALIEVTSGVDGGNYRIKADSTQIDPGVSTSVIISAGRTAFPNHIGIQNKPTGTDNSNGAEWADDTAYPAGAAEVATISGGYDIVCNQIAGTVCGGGHNYIQYQLDGHSVISGGSYNWTSAGRSVIVGGRNNKISTAGIYGIILGGLDNQVQKAYSIAAGGATNIAAGDYSVISGGQANSTTTHWTTISGGKNNIAGGEYSAILGGLNNSTSGNYSTVSGNGCTATGAYSFAFGLGAGSSIPGSLNFTSNNNLVAGDSQSISFTQSNTTTDSSSVVYLASVGTVEYAPIPDNSSWCGVVHVVGRESATGDVTAVKIDFVCQRDGGTASLIMESLTELTNQIGLADTAVNITLNIHSTGLFRIRVYGVDAKTILWTARIDIAQTIGA